MAQQNHKPELKARLLGGLSFSYGGVSFPGFSRKGTALLAYLVISGRTVSRDQLAALLWTPDRLASVRQALYELRRLPGADTWLVEDAGWVCVKGSSDYGELLEAFGAGDAAETEAPMGVLLGESFQRVAPPFDDWLEQERGRLVELRLGWLEVTASRFEHDGHYTEAVRAIDEALRIDSLNEAHYRTAMRLSQLLGNSEEALAYFRCCREELARGLALEPSKETAELAALIEQGDMPPLPGLVAALPESQRRLAQALVLANGELSVEAAAQVLSVPAFELAADLTELERRGLLDEHLVVREPHRGELLKSLSTPLRRLLHERIAELLRGDDRADDALVAGHLLAAGDAAEAAHRYVEAAKRELARTRLDAAQTLYFRALWAAAEAGDAAAKLRIEASFQLEGLAGQRGDIELQDHVLAIAERLAWEAQNDPLLAEARLRRARQLLRRGEVGEGLELALEALEIALRLADDALTARARNAVGAAHFYAGDLAGAGEAFLSALETSDKVERYRAHSNLGILAGIGTHLDESYDHFAQALTLARDVGQQVDVAAALNNLAATAERMGDYRRAVRHFKEGITLASRHEASEREGQLLVNLAVVYSRRGELGPAWNTILEVEELASASGDLRLLAGSYELKAEVARHCGAYDLALDEIASAVELAGDLQDERRWLVLGAQHAVLQVAAGSASEAVALGAIQAMVDAQLVDILPWLWLELAMLAPRAELALERLRSAEEAGLRSFHQRTVHGIATLRASLLPAECSALRREVEGLALEAEAKLASTANGSLEIVERPLLRQLLFLRQLRQAGREALPAELVPPQVTAELVEQAAGLPRALASSLEASPERWLSPLELELL